MKRSIFKKKQCFKKKQTNCVKRHCNST